MADKKFITHLLEGVQVDQRFKDGYLNATKLSKAFLAKTGTHRKPSHWLENARTQETIRHLAGSSGIPDDRLVVLIKGGPNEHRGTYLHPRLAIRFAIWLDDDFGLVVEDFITAHSQEFAAFNASRSHGVATHKFEMDALKAAGFGEPKHYINATQVVYRSLFGMDASKLREARGVPEDANLRDHLTRMELSAIDTLETRIGQLLQTESFDSFRALYDRAMEIGKGMRALLLP